MDPSTKQREALEKKIDQKQLLIENIKKGLPSKFNKMQVAPLQKIQKRKQVMDLKMDIQDLRQKKLKLQGTTDMYAFLIEAKPFSADRYQFFTYRAAKPVTVTFRGQDYEVSHGTRFGVRPSSNHKAIRLIFPDNVNRVFTIDLKTAQKLADGVGRD